MHGRLGFGFRSRRPRGKRGLACFPLAFAAENGVNNNTTRLLDFEEFVSHRMTVPPVCDARCAHVVVCRDVSDEKRRMVKCFAPGQSRHLCLTPRTVDSQTSQTTPT
jgi:hypothetical protein